MLRDQPNRNALFGTAFAEELARLGIVHVIVCPGSRSAPLVAGVVAHPRLECRLAIDERAAGFLALGIARGTREPAVVLTTSGTAAANLLPAVVESDLDGVPLLVVTADRPPELRDASANQTIDQHALFGTRVRWMCALPCPDDGVPLRFFLTSIDEAVARARGPHPGPVHVNAPFREPLAPDPLAWDARCLDGVESWGRSGTPFARRTIASPRLRESDVEEIAGLLRDASQGLVLAGSIPEARDQDAARALCDRLGWPLVADIRSGLRHGGAPETLRPHLDRLFAPSAGPPFRPDVVLVLGARPTARRVATALSTMTPATVITVDPAPRRIDPEHRPAHRVEASVAAFAAALGGHELPRAHSVLPPSIEDAHARIARAIDDAIEAGGDLTEPFVARWISRQLASAEALFLSSSMPIRDVDAFADPRGNRVSIGANRGASGIDGVLASALGFSIGHDARTTLLIGDLALLHDLGSLFLLREAPKPVGVIVFNNGGGSIFSFLPIAKHPRLLTPWFDARHDVRFEGVATDMGLSYGRAATREEFASLFDGARRHGRSFVLEIDSSLERNHAAHERIETAVAAALGTRS